uniref:Uncharacterized protein n=1 Tax=Entomoneis paludosa TaxID=265537 RepID=A0A7S2YG15_9STRA|mmetsp:Transcript_31563/g.65937  ORF Transcript_31563/g.65937 Transcript_31563/m.65937 type:complete len:303 (+) Transcript_31563:284-1192(+)|eukprot:CAMPEP_0172449154 /NCGR_PEP_ID=MMETSP1065-20121228/7929_1 /TAXON_ID=265537 /ORGANISM="Amphiprora paludosa, Strain CCMP125" /LENGTH=302 /DNA_ID=CAMNT_0013200763 /DNA_START=186 /DNA_END=1094 /DNA_ORIENTATION=+
MISTAASRSLVLAARTAGSPKTMSLRSMSSMAPFNHKKEEEKKERRELHSTSRRPADATAGTTAAVPEVATTSSMMDRFTVTAEVTVSKIFPAGFGWQTASVVADGLGYEADTLNFALTTGLGDAIGVLGGHCAYYAAKKTMYDSSIDMTKELHTGILLGSAAFCSGGVWQPLVNILQGANLPFNQVFAGTWVGCGMAFYLGLRVGRTILSGPLEHIEEPTYDNQKNDVSLSTAIGGATAFFVGTDAAYLPAQNWLIGAVGIQDGTPDLVGSAIAGTSTSMGFVAAQSTLNAVYPAGKCWND